MSETITTETMTNLQFQNPIPEDVARDLTAWIMSEHGDWPFIVEPKRIYVQPDYSDGLIDNLTDGLEIDEFVESVILARIIKKIQEVVPDIMIPKGEVRFYYPEDEYMVLIKDNVILTSYEHKHWSYPTTISVRDIEKAEKNLPSFQEE